MHRRSKEQRSEPPRRNTLHSHGATASPLQQGARAEGMRTQCLREALLLNVMPKQLNPTGSCGPQLGLYWQQSHNKVVEDSPETTNHILRTSDTIRQF
ncbi:hypothetical protein DPEC_G00111630 [Dallia pectoralis]|uniref:Uncharacterized protein n=1 Tax=Dallia pectoralis TaxID=75939 RepID=A0ACC2GTW5_DALPE|nr:hypothetical protein DPEC_G00111630 [Dallia pectoralis]